MSQIDPPGAQLFQDPREDFIRGGGYRWSEVQSHFNRARLHSPYDKFGRKVTLQLGDRQQVLNPHLMHGKFARKGPRDFFPLEAKDLSRLGVHLESVDNEQAIDPLQPREEVKTEGAAIKDGNLGRKTEAHSQHFGHSGAETIVRHQRVAEAKDQDAQCRSSGSTNLYPPKILLRVPFFSLTSISQEL